MYSTRHMHVFLTINFCVCISICSIYIPNLSEPLLSPPTLCLVQIWDIFV